MACNKRFRESVKFIVGLGTVVLCLALVSGQAQARHHHHAAKHHAAKPADVEPVRPQHNARVLIKADPSATNLQRWLTLKDEGANASFEDLDQFLRANPNWPRQKTMQALAEKRLPSTMAPHAVVAWFAGKEPETGIGMVRLGEAQLALGDKSGAALIQRAWLTESFDRAGEQQVLADHAALLSQDLQDARLAHLLYGSDDGAIRRQMARASQGAVQEATLRQSFQKTPRKALAPLPAALKDDPGVLFDAAVALRQLNRSADARHLLLRAARSDEIPPQRMWSEVVLDIRDALRAHAYQETYDLVSRHHLERGEQFADAEFLAGWIALKYLGKPDVALKHFQTLAKNVTRPISEARAEYWSGRALDALKKKDEARAHYEIAARRPYAFYGQLALARLGPHPVLRVTAEPPAATPVAKDPRMDAFRQLAAAGARDLAREFALRITDEDGLTTAKAAALIKIASLGSDRALPLKIAKHAEYQDVVVGEALHPMTIPGVTESVLPRADLLALVRQESEFDPGAVSTAGARGLMQLMPAVAQQRAKGLHLPYSPARLTSDAPYNVKLGTTHFKAFFQAWRGSYVLAIASYNAGAGNVRKWVDANGDPRDPSVDVIDWIEAIPFAETRNYVQRVVENIEVYRARLNGGSAPLDILETLKPSVAVAQAGETAHLDAAQLDAARVAVARADAADQPAHVLPAESFSAARPEKVASAAHLDTFRAVSARAATVGSTRVKSGHRSKAYAQNVLRKSKHPTHRHRPARRAIKVAKE